MHGFNTDVFFFFFFFFFLLQFPSCFNSFKKARSKLPNQLFGFRRDCRDLSVGRGLNTFHLVLQVAELDRYQDYSEDSNDGVGNHSGSKQQQQRVVLVVILGQTMAVETEPFNHAPDEEGTCTNKHNGVPTLTLTLTLTTPSP
eukprot:TRINITY_DN2587_c0_g1_i12.p1 TRINITY_DN2587_c0_g1~~TRINITY_DN2587_c0_g1_i12.p1  ORF type:complete len:143 (+),score=33.61 TRINITY_DN2587_c0_g1_i12:129-557(+)